MRQALTCAETTFNLLLHCRRQKKEFRKKCCDPFAVNFRPKLLSTKTSLLFTVKRVLISWWGTDLGQSELMLCPLLSSAAGFLLVLWGLRAPEWPWLCISFPAALPPLSGPQNTAPEAGRRTPGSAGCCSCMLQMSCCQPPDEKQERRQVCKHYHKQIKR